MRLNIAGYYLTGKDPTALEIESISVHDFKRNIIITNDKNDIN